MARGVRESFQSMCKWDETVISSWCPPWK